MIIVTYVKKTQTKGTNHQQCLIKHYLCVFNLYKHTTITLKILKFDYHKFKV